ncbi:hypothetical protein [Shouchella lonarensis]|uniref:Spore coat-associated protein N n=1 Tax=Shouchella lonarensis TaxID=1464122 RepID=A0A1G6P538_9BACI|nr:hypothetical protein [Shouchella lonarensis]SDC75370.1 spore coat-associated protein N [Shouchella lonarensis]
MKTKKLKVAMIGTAFAGALALVVGTNGSFSWFTSQTSANGELKNGTLELNNGNDISGDIVQASSFAPSQLIFGDWLKIENTGTLDAHLQATYEHEINVNASIDPYKVGYIAIKYKKTPDTDVFKDAQYELEKLFDGITNEIGALNKSTKRTHVTEDVEIEVNLIDEDEVNNAGSFVLGDGALDGEKNEFWKLEEDQYIDLNFGVKLDEKAGNEYQGAVYEATLNVLGKQTDNGALYTER